MGENSRGTRDRQTPAVRSLRRTPEENAWLRDFFNAAADRPLEPDGPKHISLYDNKELAESEPVELLARPIEWTPGSSEQLLSGFLGRLAQATHALGDQEGSAALAEELAAITQPGARPRLA